MIFEIISCVAIQSIERISRCWNRLVAYTMCLSVCLSIYMTVCLWWSVYLSVCPVGEMWKTADWIWMPSGVVSGVDQEMGVVY